jgi:hypothetical protein
MSVPVSFKREGAGARPLGTHDEVASLPATTQEETSADESDTGA